MNAQGDAFRKAGLSRLTDAQAPNLNNAICRLITNLGGDLHLAQTAVQNGNAADAARYLGMGDETLMEFGRTLVAANVDLDFESYMKTLS